MEMTFSPRARACAALSALRPTPPTIELYRERYARPRDPSGYCGLAVSFRLDGAERTAYLNWDRGTVELTPPPLAEGAGARHLLAARLCARLYGLLGDERRRAVEEGDAAAGRAIERCLPLVQDRLDRERAPQRAPLGVADSLAAAGDADAMGGS